MIFWKNSIYVLFQSKNVVDFLVDGNGSCLYLSFDYGDPNPSNINYLWERLERISTTIRYSWLIIGNFNEVRGNEEKSGGPRQAERSFMDFR